MNPKDPTYLTSRWPVMKALRNRLRRMIVADSAQLKLKMETLETERLVLRKFAEEDLKDIIAWEDGPSAHSVEFRAREFLNYCFREYREWGFGPWAMVLKETGAIVGNCGFPHIVSEKFCGEVNYYIAPCQRGKGLAPESLKALLKFGFANLGLKRIQARCEPDNFSSERVMQKVGMKYEGWIEHAPLSKDPIPRQKLYVILREDFTLADNGIDKSTINTATRSEDRS